MAASGELPLGARPGVAQEPNIAPEPAEISARAFFVASRLLAGATTFFFLAFVFAYFYLRSINEEHKWRPPHIDPDQALGAGMIACVVLSALLTIIGGRAMNARARGA